jgi:hypothetical protein
LDSIGLVELIGMIEERFGKAVSNIVLACFALLPVLGAMIGIKALLDPFLDAMSVEPSLWLKVGTYALGSIAGTAIGMAGLKLLYRGGWLPKGLREISDRQVASLAEIGDLNTETRELYHKASIASLLAWEMLNYIERKPQLSPREIQALRNALDLEKDAHKEFDRLLSSLTAEHEATKPQD